MTMMMFRGSGGAAAWIGLGKGRSATRPKANPIRRLFIEGGFGSHGNIVQTFAVAASAAIAAGAIQNGARPIRGPRVWNPQWLLQDQRMRRCTQSAYSVAGRVP